MNTKTKEIYSEVYSVLNKLGNDYINKIPDNLYKMIKQEKLEEYNPKYIFTINLEEQKIKKESIAMIALFHLNYWCDSNEEKEKLRKLFKENENKYQTELCEKYNPDNIFKNRCKPNVENQETNNKNQEKIKNAKEIIKYKESIFKRILNKIKMFFNK